MTKGEISVEGGEKFAQELFQAFMGRRECPAADQISRFMDDDDKK